MRRVDSDAVLRAATTLGTIAGTVALASVVLEVVHGALPAVSVSELAELLTGPWSPSAEPPRYGLAHAIVSTLRVTSFALAVATPTGILLGLFASEVAPEGVRRSIVAALELLAGVPSVVYGLLGYATLVPFFERALGMPVGESLLAAGLVLAVMIVPFVASTTADACFSVPSALREAGVSLGATRAYVAVRVVLRAARPGIAAGVALALARAMGETLAVLMLAGNSTALPRGILERGQPLTALIATELGESVAGSPKASALMLAGVLLLAVGSIANGAAWLLRESRRSRDAS